MKHRFRIAIVVSLAAAVSTSSAQNSSVSVVKLELGKPLTFEFPEERRARQVAEIFKSTVETVKVERQDQELFPRFQVLVMYPERVVVNVGAEQIHPNLEACLRAYSIAADAVSAAYRFRVVNQGSQTVGDIEVSLGCVVKGQLPPNRQSPFTLSFMARSVSATDTWLARDAKKYKK